MAAVGDVRKRGVLWRRCRRMVEQLDLPRPFDAGEFIGLLALERGRPIELVRVAARPHLPCGLVVTTDETDVILYSADTSALHQRHILLHEAAHLLCGHAESRASVAGRGGPHGSGLTSNAQGSSPEATAAGAIGGLLPHLPTELVHRVLGRTAYTEPQEREAEIVASLILYRVGRDEGLPERAPEPHSRLAAIFGLPES